MLLRHRWVEEIDILHRKPTLLSWGRQSRSLLTLGIATSILAGCGGGGGASSSDSTPESAPPDPGTPIDTSDCSVVVTTDSSARAWPATAWETATPASQGLCPDELQTARDYTFIDGNGTGAFLVIKNGYVVFEEYVEEKTADDLVTSWSVAKSVMSLLMGTAIEDGYFRSLDEQSASEFVPPWQDDRRADITLRHLMTVRSALEVVIASAFYISEDQLPMSVDRELIGDPGNRLYNYSNADIMVAGEVLRVATGMDASQYLQVKVNGTIGIQSAEWWIDGASNVLTYCCLDATPKDFARFGLLYARWGEWNGTQVVSSEWVETSTEYARTLVGNESETVEVEAGYGFYWWPILNNGFGAFGLNSQILAIYPDIDMVVLRFSDYTRLGTGEPIRVGVNFHGTTVPSNFDNATFLSLVYEALREDSD